MKNRNEQDTYEISAHFVQYLSDMLHDIQLMDDKEERNQSLQWVRKTFHEQLENHESSPPSSLNEVEEKNKNHISTTARRETKF
jgi:hypothetical protein